MLKSLSDFLGPAPADQSLGLSRLKALLSLATGAVAEPAAGVAGLYGLIHGGLDEGADRVERTRQKLTYVPSDTRGLQEIQQAIAPVANAYANVKDRMGGAALNYTGSPGLATAAAIAPDVLLSMIGARPAASAAEASTGTLGRIVSRADRLATEAPRMHPQAGMVAYHGTPYRFDRFDLSKIGTGEGAQAYGHGQYLAGAKEVAEQYRTQLSDGTFLTPSGEVFDPSSLEHINLRTIARRDGLNAAFEKAMEIAQSDSPVAGHARRDANRLLEAAGAQRNQGNLYHVDVPDEHVANMLDWDKPILDQPHVVEALRKHPNYRDFSAFEGDAELWPDKKDWQTGRDLYGQMSSYARGYSGGPISGAGLGDAGASRILRELGIPGIRYLDGMSRGAGEGTSNYVLFDPSIARIVGRE